jgi:hypothetical protein
LYVTRALVNGDSESADNTGTIYFPIFLVAMSALAVTFGGKYTVVKDAARSRSAIKKIECGRFGVNAAQGVLSVNLGAEEWYDDPELNQSFRCQVMFPLIAPFGNMMRKVQDDTCKVWIAELYYTTILLHAFKMRRVVETCSVEMHDHVGVKHFDNKLTREEFVSDEKEEVDSEQEDVRAILQEQDSSMLLMKPGENHKIFDMDLEYGKAEKEFKVNGYE